MKKCIYSLILISLIGISCSSDEERYTLPYAPVNFYIKTEVTDMFLKTTGNMGVYINSAARTEYANQVAANGVKGVLIVNAPRLKEEYIGLGGLLVINTGLAVVGESNYTIYDLACTHEKNGDTRIVPISTMVARCPKCGSEFQILEGTGRVSKGPANEQLQKYSILESERNVFRIFR